MKTIPLEVKRTIYELLKQGLLIREVEEITGISKSTIGKYKKKYEWKGDKVFRELDEEESAKEVTLEPIEKIDMSQWKKANISGMTWEEFQEEWNRTRCSIIGDMTPPEHFVEDWLEAVNRIRRFYGLDDIRERVI